MSPKPTSSGDRECSTQGDRRVDGGLCAASVIAILALLLRVSMTGFPTTGHPDEPIVATLTKRCIDTGTVSANWDGFGGTVWWSRPTYQFSPYTLTQSIIAQITYLASRWPSTVEDHILLARLCSCCWGGLSVMLTFLIGRSCLCDSAALWAAATLAVCFVHCQDSIYARVDAFVCFMVLVATYWAVVTARRPKHLPWLAITSASVGMVIATKWNAFAAVLLVGSVLWQWTNAGGLSLPQLAYAAVVSCLAMVLGFVIATPEALWNVNPLLAGLSYEANHYSAGHRPHEAYDLLDNNVFYWTRYVTQLGFGWLQSCAVGVFALKGLKRCRFEHVMFMPMLVVAVGVFVVTKVRFERNMEVFLGLMALAAGAMANAAFTTLIHRDNRHMARALASGFAVVWFCQPMLTVFRFSNTVDDKTRMDRNLADVTSSVPTAKIYACNFQPHAVFRDFRQILLVDFGDNFSSDGCAQCKRFLKREPTHELASRWSSYGYPFSTVDVYHGPHRILIWQK